MAPKKKRVVKIDYPPVPQKKWIPPYLRPKKKPPPKYEKPPGISQKLKISSLQKIWKQYNIYDDVAVLCGDFSVSHIRYGKIYGGFHGAACCVAAIAVNRIRNVKDWNRHLLNEVIDLGFHIYRESLKNHPCQTTIYPEDIYNTFYINEFKVTMSLDRYAKTCERFTSVCDHVDVFMTFLKKFFESHSFGIVSIREEVDKHIAVMKTDGGFYFMDPYDHDCHGNACAEESSHSVVVKCLKMETFARSILSNFPNLECKFDMIPCCVSRLVAVNPIPPSTFEETYLKTDTSCTRMAETLKSQPIPTPVSSDSTLTVPAGVVHDTVEDDAEKDIKFPQMPEERARLEEYAYYKWIVENQSQILRGTNHQTNPKFSKFLGRQALANAVSALAMLRIHKPKLWIPKTIDDILMYGELMYCEAMAIRPRGYTLKLANFPKRFRYENRTLTPEIDEFAVLGKLNSTEAEVLDLNEAMENFLTEHSCGIIQGPLVLAFWIYEGRYFVFDPNERDGKGLKVPKPVEDLPGPPPGYACVTWYKSLKSLMDTYLANLPMESRRDYFVLSKVHMKDFAEKPPKWNNFMGVCPSVWILRGTFNQSNKKFPVDTRNTQCTGMCIIALAMKTFLKTPFWSCRIVDAVLDTGDDYYRKCLEELEETGKFKDKRLMMAEVKKIYEMKGKVMEICVDDCLINGLITAKPQNDVYNLKRGLEQFFIDYTQCVITARDISVAVWFYDDYYFMFDSHSRDESGYATGYGCACVMRFVCIMDLVKWLEANMNPGSEDLFNISNVEFKFYEKAEDGTIKQPPNHYTMLQELVAILRGLYNAESKIFPSTYRGKQCVPMCMVALGLNKLTPAAIWRVKDLDEILDLGNKIYYDTMVELEKDLENEETEVTVGNVIKEFRIGLNKFNMDYEEVARGRIKNDLKPALEAQYEQEPTEEDPNQELFLQTKDLSLDIFRDAYSYYLFDPRPRDPKGYVYGKYDWDSDEGDSELTEIEEPVPEEEGEEGEEIELEVQDEVQEVIDETVEANIASEGEEVEEDEEEGEEEIEEEEIVEPPRPKLKKGSAYWRKVKKEYGKSFIMKFAKLEDLISQIYENVEPKKRRREEFVLYKVKVQNQPEVKDRYHPDLEDKKDDIAGDWHNFEEIEYQRWILRGSRNLDDGLFPEINHNRQAIPSAFTALTYGFLFNVAEFKETTVDDILIYGDRLFTFVLRMKIDQLRKDGLIKDDCQAKTMAKHMCFFLDDIIRHFCISKYNIRLDLEKDFVVGDIKAQNFEEVLDVLQGLEKFFHEESYGLLDAKGLVVAIWKTGEDTYYMFDAKPRGPSGVFSSDGVPCITRYKRLDKMADVFLANLAKIGTNRFAIHKVGIIVEKCKKERTPPEESKKPPKPKMPIFKTIGSGKYILRASQVKDCMNAAEPLPCQAPIAFISLAMSFIHKSSTWTRPILDEILRLGQNLFEDSQNNPANQYNPWEGPMNVWNVNKDFYIGVVRVNCEMQFFDQTTGIVGTKDTTVTMNLRQGVEKFFKCNTHGILTIADLAFPIWEENVETYPDPLIFVFDPNPRGPTGLPLALGNPCLLVFCNHNILHDHFCSVLNSEQKQSTFYIVAANLMVETKGTKMRTKRKVEVSLPKCSKVQASAKKRLLRQIAEEERKRKEARKMAMLGREEYWSLSKEEALLRACRSQTSEHYSAQSRGKQDVTNCIVAVVMNKLTSVDHWSYRTLDMVLDIGNQLYIDSYVVYSPLEDEKLGMENVLRRFFVRDIEVRITVYKPIISAIMDFDCLFNILSCFFQQETNCILCFKNMWVAMFFKGGMFYVFDPHDRDLNGNAVENGSAVLYKIDNVETMCTRLISTLVEDLEEERGCFMLYIIDVTSKGEKEEVKEKVVRNMYGLSKCPPVFVTKGNCRDF